MIVEALTLGKWEATNFKQVEVESCVEPSYSEIITNWGLSLPNTVENHDEER